MKNSFQVSPIYQHKIDWVLIVTLIFLFFAYLLFHSLFGGTLFSYNDWDSYTLQALAWRNGAVSLPQNYSWLELAEYNGNYFVSFPPVPSLVMFPLTFLFEGLVPSNFIIMLYALLSITFAYKCFQRTGLRKLSAMFWALFFVLGSNMLWMSTSGGSWFLAQALNMTLCFAAILSLLYHKKALCLTLLALAVGCRPFSVCFFFAVFLYLVLSESRKSHNKFFLCVLRQTRYLIIPACIAAGYLLYNFIRFQDPFEFGHNYLPEFTGVGNAQFGLEYLPANAYNIFLRLPSFSENGAIVLPLFDGFMFYLANPIFIVWFVRLAADIIQKQMTPEKAILAVGLALNLFLLLIHKTFGGWQFGARYTVDLLPFVLSYLLFSPKQKPRKWEIITGAFAILFNLYGALLMHLQLL